MNLRLSNKGFVGLLWVAVVIAVLIFSYDTALRSLIGKWNAINENYSHGYIILIIAFYWIIDALDKSGRPVSAAVSAIPVALGVATIWYFGWSTQMLILEQLTLPLVLYTVFLSYYGWRIVWSLALPFVFIYLALPAWDIAQPGLRILTTLVVQFWISLVNIPAFVDGFLIELPYGVLKVAGGCAGLNYFMMGLVIGTMYARQSTSVLWKGLLSVSIALGFSLLANWVRVFILVLIGYHSNMESPIVYQHGLLGWGVFGFALVLYFVCMRYFQPCLDRFFPETLSDLGGSNKIVDEVDLRDIGRQRSGFFSGAKWLDFAIPCIVTGIFVALPQYSKSLQSGVGESGEAWFVGEVSASWEPVLNPQLRVAYQNWTTAGYWRSTERSGLELYAYRYLHQVQGAEMIYYENMIAHEDKLKVIENIRLPGLPEMSLVRVRGDGRDFLLMWVYKLGERYTTSSIQGKYFQFLEAMGGRTRASFIAFTLACSEKDCLHELERFRNEQTVFGVNAKGVLDQL